MNCPLCYHEGMPWLKDEYFLCSCCSGIFKNSHHHISNDDERKRYEQHNNDVNDPGYQKFVSPITSFVLNTFPPQSVGLDFGAGTGPVISKILKGQGYSIRQYDPFFLDDKSLLAKQYDYIVCCEVIEHFHNPCFEFGKLYEMLNSKGALICMTHLYTPDIPFQNWYYKNDPTHVFIYQQATIAYIAEAFQFKSFKIRGRLIVWRK